MHGKTECGALVGKELSRQRAHVKREFFHRKRDQRVRAKVARGRDLQHHRRKLAEVPPEDSRRVLLLCEAALKSSQTGKPVRIKS